MIFRDKLSIACDVNVPVSLGVVRIQNLEGEELLEMGDGGEAGHADEPPGETLHLVRVRALQQQVDLLIKSVIILSLFLAGPGPGPGLSSLVLVLVLLLLCLLLCLSLHVFRTWKTSFVIKLPLSFVLRLLQPGH